MKADIKNRWIAALLSGGYKQGRGALFQRDWKNGDPRFCALGVLCDLAQRDGVVAPWVEASVRNDLGERAVRVRGLADGAEFENSFAPPAVLAWAGLSAAAATAVADLNDRRVSFAWIANAVKKGEV